MVSLDKIVSQVVTSYQAVFGTMAIIGIGGTMLQQNWFGLLFLIPSLSIGYWIGLQLIAWALPKFLTTEFIVMEFRRERINQLNKKLESGELVADSPELAEEMKACGLKPLSVITEKGPVFAQQFGVPLYEWVDSKENGSEEVGRYFFVGLAAYDPEDGTVKIEGDDPTKLHLVLEGFLYERTLEQDSGLADAE
jgi:hypothetical protein